MHERGRVNPIEAVLDGPFKNKQDISEQIGLYPGYEIIKNNPSDYPYRIAGRYGLLWKLPKELGSEPVAQAGFSFKESSLIVTNSPQGLVSSDMADLDPAIRRAVLTELRKGDYKVKLVEQIILFGKAFRSVGVERIIGTSAANHHKVDSNGGPLPYSQAVKSMDQVYEALGFEQDEEGDYFSLIR